MKPYIGITDFTCKKEVADMLSVFIESFPSGNRTLMVGTMMSYKTLNGLPTKWEKSFPKVEQYHDIFYQKHNFLLNTLHYADYEKVTEPDDLAKAIIIAGHRGPFETPTLNALQLDMSWPSKNLIQKAITKAESLIDESNKDEDNLKDLKVILQIGSTAMKEVNNDPRIIAKKIFSYGSSIDAVLFDRSGGLGKKMDSNLLYPYVAETILKCPNIKIAVAGGLGPDTLDLIIPLVQEFPNISIDAQGRLRRSGNALDPIDWDLAERYIRKAGEIFK